MRIRTIKPEFFLHVLLHQTEKETGLPIRVAFAGLWCAADREGRFRWEPQRLKVQILPYDEVDFSRVLDALTTRGFLVRYASLVGEFGYIPSFHKHQFINPREKESELPDPLQCVDVELVDACPTRAPRVNDACPTRLSLPFPSLPKGESERKKDHYHKDSRVVLHILNEACGAHFREVDSNLSVISARLNEPEVTLEGVRQMIQRQCKRWKGTSQAEYLRPETLFAKSKFDSYYASRELPINGDNGKSSQKSVDRNAGTANEGRAALYDQANRQKLGTVQTAQQVPEADDGTQLPF